MAIGSLPTTLEKLMRAYSVFAEDGRMVESPAPKHLESRRVMLIDIYGSLYYAGARTLQARCIGGTLSPYCCEPSCSVTRPPDAAGKM